MTTHPTKLKPIIIVSYLLIFALFGVSMYVVQKQNVNTEQRTRATNAVSCDYTIDITSPTPTPLVQPATGTPTEMPLVEETPPTVSTEPIVSPQPTPPTPLVRCERETSLVIAIDRSQSMNHLEATGKTKLDFAKDAARAFVAAIKASGSTDIAISIVSFGGQGNDGKGKQPNHTNATLHAGASTDYDEIMQSIDGMGGIQSGGTCIQCALRIGNDQLANVTNTKAFILLTDGIANRVWNGSQSDAKSVSVSEATSGKNKGISYYVIGFGDKNRGQIDEMTLKAIASGGQYVYKPDAQTWMKSFFELLPKFCTEVGE